MAYSKEVMEHFFNPRNVGELPDANATGIAKNPHDGDVAKLFLKIEDDRIRSVTFKTMGCVVAIAASSKLTQLVQEKTVAEALSIDKNEMTAALGGLPENKIRCSLTCIEALHQAIDEFKSNRLV